MVENPDDLINKYDKSNWREGPWDNEPDRKDFVYLGYSCFALRNALGNWCGYVGIPESHPLFMKSYDDAPIDVHGGLTYGALCSPPICHIPAPGMPEKVWWLGFDTAHYGDISPSRYMPQIASESYKDLNYTESEIKRMAEQLKVMEHEKTAIITTSPDVTK